MVRIVAALRAVGILEGLSFLVLLGIAMPLKYLAHLPQAVAVVGGIHGVLFVIYVMMALFVTVVFKLPFWRFGQAVVASLVPAGTFWFDRKLRDLQKTITGQSSKP